MPYRDGLSRSLATDGLGTFVAKKGAYLRFEPGPTTDVVLQWATYYDAADQAGLSRLYGGIHVPVDDGPGRVIGSQCGIGAWDLAVRYFDGSIAEDPIVTHLHAVGTQNLQFDWNATRGAFYKLQQTNDLNVGDFIDASEWIWAGETSESFQLEAPPPASPETFFRVIRSHTTP